MDSLTCSELEAEATDNICSVIFQHSQYNFLPVNRNYPMSQNSLALQNKSLRMLQSR